MKHVYLAPHLDDAVLSCGSAIHHHTAAGKGVQVVTLFAGEAGRDTSLSGFAREQHAQWGGLSQPMRRRRAEDVAALAVLGAEARHLDYHDAMYRTGPGDHWLYRDLEAFFGDPHPVDPVAVDGARELADQLAKAVPLDGQQVLCAPLGVGHHVDHQIVHTAARRLLARGHRVAFYEDFPYAEQEGAVALALAEAGAGDWLEEPVAVDAADVSAKVSALSHYRSQMTTLFGGMEAMPGRVWAFAATRAPGAHLAERIWWPQ
jgi:LmbE family N-acetylglucosaminyl deacetylase